MARKFIPRTGGHPFVGDDINWTEDGAREMVESILRAFAVQEGSTLERTFILHGCEITSGGGGTYNVAAGWVCLEGEPCQVEAHTFTAADLTSVWARPVITYDPATVDYEDGNVYEVYQFTKVIFAATSGGVSGAALLTSSYGLKTFDNQLVRKSWSDGAWNVVDAGDAPPFLGDWENFGSSYQQAEYRKMAKGQVFLRGSVKSTSSASAGPNIFVLPAGYRPFSHLRFAATIVYPGDNTEPVYINIQADGTVSVENAGNADADKLSFDGISFFAAGSI